MRYATVITLYKKTIGATKNVCVNSIIVAYSEDDAIIKAIGNESVSMLLKDGYKMVWKVALEIPELNTDTGEYELLSEKL